MLDRENLGPEGSFAVFGTYAVRNVPLDWQHPTDEVGRLLALAIRDTFTPEELEEIGDEVAFMPDFSDIPAERMGLCVYEEISDGTPLSPIFPDTPEGRKDLLHHATQKMTLPNGEFTNLEEWTRILSWRGSHSA